MKKLYLTLCLALALLFVPAPMAHAFSAADAELCPPAALTEIGDEAFRGSAVESAYLPDKLTSIGALAFADCAELREIRIPASVTFIADDAFDGHRSDLKIYCEPNSAARSFAIKHNINFSSENSGSIVLPEI